MLSTKLRIQNNNINEQHLHDGKHACRGLQAGLCTDLAVKERQKVWKGLLPVRERSGSVDCYRRVSNGRTLRKRTAAIAVRLAGTEAAGDDQLRESSLAHQPTHCRLTKAADGSGHGRAAQTEKSTEAALVRTQADGCRAGKCTQMEKVSRHV